MKEKIRAVKTNFLYKLTKFAESTTFFWIWFIGKEKGWW